MDLIGIPEAAEILRVHRVTVWDWVQRKTLKPAVLIGSGQNRRALFDRSYIEEFAKRREAEITQEATA